MSDIAAVGEVGRLPAQEAMGRLVPLKPQISSDADIAKLKEAARQFESYYIFMMLKEMRRTVPKEGLLNSGLGHDTYISMYDEAMAEEMSKTGTLGLSDALVEQYRRSAAVGGNLVPLKLPEGISEKGQEELMRGNMKLPGR
jgi:Rod binding domain-containing protein